MKLIDGDALMKEFLHLVKMDPDLCWDDVEWLINDAEEIEAEELVPHAEAFKTGAEWALDQVEKDIADKIRTRLRG